MAYIPGCDLGLFSFQYLSPFGLGGPFSDKSALSIPFKISTCGKTEFLGVAKIF